jgi:hypothetical protein
MAGIFVPIVFNTPDIFVSIFSTLFYFFCIASCLFSTTKLFKREIFTRTGAFFLVDKPIKHIFMFTPSVGIKHFEVDGKHVFAYF